MKKGIFAMFILVASMAMVACTNNTSTEGATGENDAFKALEKKREYYKAQDKERAKLEAEAKKAEEKAMKEAENQMETTTEEVAVPVTVDDAEARKAEEKAMKEAAKAKEAADKEALKILEKKRKGN
ncbi:hypothetical protein KST17_01730 [Fusobacterium canifelinum]|uniref:RadB family lipoprotein n=1 Tax=Fusobacterium canifelinum TaxID=285729 RepID=UPI0030CE579E